MSERLDVLVIGAGQAGLAVGYHLRRLPVTFRLYDRHERVGDVWRERYDSLRLFSPRAFSALPGLALPGDPAGYASKDELADYLEQYARIHELPVVLGEGIIDLELEGGRFLARTSHGGEVSASAVVVAAGAFQLPVVPVFAIKLAADLPQFTAASYRNPAQVASGRVLVVGDGATGRQIARELVPSHEVWLSTGKRRTVVPQRILGRDSMWWFSGLGLLKADRDSWLGRQVRTSDTIPGLHLRLSALRRAGVRVVGRTVDATGRRLVFGDGTAAPFDAVIWTLGYRDDASWIDIPSATDGRGTVIEDRGLSPAHGLFHVGRSWQNNRASSLLCGVGDDALEVVHMVARGLRAQPQGDAHARRLSGSAF